MNITDEIIVKKVKQGILSIDKDAEVILFGSRARGDARKDSDWDFLFLTDKVITSSFEDELIYKILDVELEENAVVQVISKSKKEWETKYPVTALYLNIKDEGIRL